MEYKKLLFITVGILAISLLAISLFTLNTTQTVSAKNTIEKTTNNIKVYNQETKTITIKDKKEKDMATIELLTPIDNKVGTGYQRIAEYKVTGKMDINDFFGEILTYDKNKYDKGELNSLNKKVDLKYKTTEDYLVNDYTCSDKISKNGTMEECKISGSHIEQRTVWKEFNKNAKVKNNEEIIIGIYTNTEQGEYGEWIQYFAGIPVKEWATWTSDLNTNIESYFKYEENAIDSIGNWNGTNGGTADAVGIIDRGRYFDSGDNIAIGDIMDERWDDFTLNMWVNVTLANRKNLMGKYYASGYRSFSWFVQDDGNCAGGMNFEASFNGVNSVNEYCGGVIPTNEWTMATVTYSSPDLKTYINGINTGNYTIAGGLDDNSASWLIGDDPYSPAKITGTIDEVMISRQEFTTAQVLQLYNDGDAITYEDLPTTYCTFSGYVFDENSNALEGANVTIFNQYDVTEYYENTTDSNGYWLLRLTNSTNTYMAGAYYNNSLIGQLKPFVSGTC